MASSQITPTFVGIILSSRDALILFTEAIRGHLPMINRRPHDKERSTSICSGNIFIYCEHNSSIKRWTDGVTWSPSRIMGNFLIYRELNKGFPPGEKKRAAKKRPPQDSGSDAGYETEENPPVLVSKDEERMLIGSLIDSYDFKKEGLVKKTISVKVEENTYHLVSYYNVRHAVGPALQRPSLYQKFSNTRLIEELISNQSFRVSVDINGNDLASGNSNNTPPQSHAPPSPILPGGQIGRHFVYPESEDPYNYQGHQQYMGSPVYHPHSILARSDHRVGRIDLRTGQPTYIDDPHNPYNRPIPNIPPRNRMDMYALTNGYNSYQDTSSRQFSGDGGLGQVSDANGSGGSRTGIYSSGGYSGTTDPSSYTSGSSGVPIGRYTLASNPMGSSEIKSAPPMSNYQRQHSSDTEGYVPGTQREHSHDLENYVPSVPRNHSDIVPEMESYVPSVPRSHADETPRATMPYMAEEQVAFQGQGW